MIGHVMIGRPPSQLQQQVLRPCDHNVGSYDPYSLETRVRAMVFERRRRDCTRRQRGANRSRSRHHAHGRPRPDESEPGELVEVSTSGVGVSFCPKRQRADGCVGDAGVGGGGAGGSRSLDLSCDAAAKCGDNADCEAAGSGSKEALEMEGKVSGPTAPTVAASSSAAVVSTAVGVGSEGMWAAVPQVAVGT